MAQLEKSLEGAVDRRRMLLASAVIAGAPLSSASAHAAAGDPSPVDDAREVRYRETEHIRTFYERSRF